MELTALAVTAITNFILAGETFFVSGLLFARSKSPRSAAWFWQIALLLLAISALIGGIDHGFFEVFGQTPARKTIQHINWLFLGLLTLFVFLTAARQFFKPPLRNVLYIIAGVQLVLYTILSLMTESFLVVIVNYAPVMLLMLVMTIKGLRERTGSWAMVAGIIISFAASGVQAAGLDVFSPFDRDSLYHFGMMAAVVCFYVASAPMKTNGQSE
ncbi:MAG: hypothetical protein JXB07_06395 [Anaerolineae bacterium]|nr:hypothetical protein [Anaerolineae bacterium]